MAKPIDIKGQRLGKLTVLELVPEEKRRNSYKRREWLCKCDCGNLVVIE